MQQWRAGTTVPRTLQAEQYGKCWCFFFSSEHCAQHFHISCGVFSDAWYRPHPLRGGRGSAQPAGKLRSLNSPAVLKSRLELVLIGQNLAFPALPCHVLCIHKILVIQRFWLGMTYTLFLNPLRTRGGKMHFVYVWFWFFGCFLFGFGLVFFFSKGGINLGLQSKEKT